MSETVTVYHGTDTRCARLIMEQRRLLAAYKRVLARDTGRGPIPPLLL